MFSKIGATVSNKYHVQLQKSICCSEKSEGATIDILLKKTCNFIRKRLHCCEVYKNTRNNHQRCSVKKGVLINFAKFTGKHRCQSLFLNKVAGLFWKSSVNGCFRKSVSQWQISRRKVISNFFYPFIALNFAMTEWFCMSHDLPRFACYFYHKKVVTWKLQHFYHKEFITHIKWDVIISSSLRLLLKVLIWLQMSK